MSLRFHHCTYSLEEASALCVLNWPFTCCFSHFQLRESFIVKQNEKTCFLRCFSTPKQSLSKYSRNPLYRHHQDWLKPLYDRLGFSEKIAAVGLSMSLRSARSNLWETTCAWSDSVSKVSYSRFLFGLIGGQLSERSKMLSAPPPLHKLVDCFINCNKLFHVNAPIFFNWQWRTCEVFFCATKQKMFSIQGLVRWRQSSWGFENGRTMATNWRELNRVQFWGFGDVFGGKYRRFFLIADKFTVSGIPRVFTYDRKTERTLFLISDVRLGGGGALDNCPSCFHFKFIFYQDRVLNRKLGTFIKNLRTFQNLLQRTSNETSKKLCPPTQQRVGFSSCTTQTQMYVFLWKGNYLVCP